LRVDSGWKFNENSESGLNFAEGQFLIIRNLKVKWQEHCFGCVSYRRNSTSRPRYIVAHYSMLMRHPKQSFLPNIKACAKSSSHREDFAHALIFGWFDDALLVMSVKNLAF
jgi:hypothetical protein